MVRSYEIILSLDVYVFKLDFTILKGATYSDELKNSDSDTYLKLKKDLESSVS